MQRVARKLYNYFVPPSIVTNCDSEDVDSMAKLPVAARILKWCLFSTYLICVLLTLVYSLFLWVDMSADEERRVEFFAKVILVVTVVMIDILMLIAMFGMGIILAMTATHFAFPGVVINNYIILEAFAGLSMLFVAFNLFNVRNFRVTGWVGLGLTFLLCFASIAYAQMLRRFRLYNGRRAVNVQYEYEG